MVWMPSRLSRVPVLTRLWRVAAAQVEPAHGAHGPMVERSKHLYHLRSQAPVLSTKEKYVEHQTVVHAALGLDRDIFALEVQRGRPVPCLFLCSPLALDIAACSPCPCRPLLYMRMCE